MLINEVLAIAVAVLAAPAMAQTAMPQRKKIAIVGATLIDVSGYGRSTNDDGDSVVLIDDGKITVAGPGSQVPIPSGPPASMHTESF
jgi:imidazolonepropionase-like amidohydrolase